MFERIANLLKGVLRKLFSRSEIANKIAVDVAVSGEMQVAIDLWTKIYENRAPWLSSTVQSMNLGSAIASELSRMITLEFNSEVSGSERAEYINEQYQTFLTGLRHYVEWGCAKGGVAFKPYPKNGKIAVDVVQADRFYPTAFDASGRITGAVFVERITRGKYYYTRLESHNVTSEGYVLTNSAYESDNKDTLGKNISLESVPEWSSLEPEVLIKNVDRQLFGYYKVAQANIIDTDSPLGESCFSRAIDSIKEADKQWSRLLWEYEGGELAIELDTSLFKKDEKTGKPIIPQGKFRLFRGYNGLGDGEGMRTFNPALRDNSYISGLNEILMRIEDICLISRGTFSNVQETARTATELKIMRQRTYANVKDNQSALQTALADLINAIDVYVDLYELAPSGEYTVSYDWDDSIIMDAESEREKKLAEVSAGIIRPEVYLAETRGITVEEAKALMPEMTQLVE